MFSDTTWSEVITVDKTLFNKVFSCFQIPRGPWLSRSTKHLSISYFMFSNSTWSEVIVVGKTLANKVFFMFSDTELSVVNMVDKTVLNKVFFMFSDTTWSEVNMVGKTLIILAVIIALLMLTAGVMVIVCNRYRAPPKYSKI